MKRSKGYRSGTRRLLKKKPRERGKLRLSRLLHNYTDGSQVVINLDPSVQKGMPHKRYHGRVGTVVRRRGRSYIVNVTQGKVVKKVIVRPEHLQQHKE